MQETIIPQNGEVRFIVQRTTEIYGSPINALHISNDTKLIGSDGEAISITDILPGYSVKVRLADSFVEETPFYYPTVHEVRIIKKLNYKLL